MSPLEKAARAVWEQRRKVDPNVPRLDESEDPEFYIALIIDEIGAALRSLGIDPSLFDQRPSGV